MTDPKVAPDQVGLARERLKELRSQQSDYEKLARDEIWLLERILSDLGMIEQALNTFTSNLLITKNISRVIDYVQHRVQELREGITEDKLGG